MMCLVLIVLSIVLFILGIVVYSSAYVSSNVSRHEELKELDSTIYRKGDFK